MARQEAEDALNEARALTRAVADLAKLRDRVLKLNASLNPGGGQTKP